ncbi:MAG TPA: phage tail tape measure protein [Nitrososphaera sp.]|jgi:hypothetical protein
MTEKRGGKLHDIKETASDAVEIMRELGTPGVRESFDIIKEVAVIAKEMMETMKTPEWQRNMENIRVISENMNNSSIRVDRVSKELKETGFIDDGKGLIKAIKDKIGPVADSKGQQAGETTMTTTTTTTTSGGGGSISGQDLKELSTAIKEMLDAVKKLAEELRVTVEDSKSSGTMHNIKETIRETSEAYGAVKREIEEKY